MFKKNKKGWIRIVEAFVAILLIAGVLLIVINQGYIGKKDISEKVYGVEISILREIELNDQMRNELLFVDLSVTHEPPSSVKNKISNSIPDYLSCDSRICPLNEICTLEGPAETNVYAQSVAITANLSTYNPRQLKIFCWEN